MLTVLVILGIAVLALGALSVVGALLTGLFWLVTFPIRLAFRIVFGTIGLVFGLFGLVFGGVFGLLGGLFGLVFGLFGSLIGGIFGLLGGLLGGLFGLVFSPTGLLFGIGAILFGVFTHLLPLSILAIIGAVIYKGFFAARIAA